MTTFHAMEEAPSTIRPRAHTEVSCHLTSEGTVLWLRCTECGRLRMLLVPDAADRRPIAAGTRTPGCPTCF